MKRRLLYKVVFAVLYKIQYIKWQFKRICFSGKEVVVSPVLQKVSNHPVHFIAKEPTLSPSAFIPFCGFGGNMTAVGEYMDEIEVPVCNSFKAKILLDQLCYEIDLNRFSRKDNKEEELKLGFTFLMDFNEDRQIAFKDNKTINDPSSTTNNNLMFRSIVDSDIETASIYLDTIGIILYVCESLSPNLNTLYFIYSACKTDW